MRRENESGTVVANYSGGQRSLVRNGSYTILSESHATFPASVAR